MTLDTRTRPVLTTADLLRGLAAAVPTLAAQEGLSEEQVRRLLFTWETCRPTA